MDIVAKKWEPRNPVPGPFSDKIRKVVPRLDKLSQIRNIIWHDQTFWAVSKSMPMLSTLPFHSPTILDIHDMIL